MSLWFDLAYYLYTEIYFGMHMIRNAGCGVDVYLMHLNCVLYARQQIAYHMHLKHVRIMYTPKSISAYQKHNFMFWFGELFLRRNGLWRAYDMKWVGLGLWGRYAWEYCVLYARQQIAYHMHAKTAYNPNSGNVGTFFFLILIKWKLKDFQITWVTILFTIEYR